jgi:Raf kinase inhibitor-like YbhB/YbcL family protein
MTLKSAILAVGLMLAAGTARAEGLTLTSPDLTDGGTMPERHVLEGFGCHGGNLSPALAWSGAPAGTESFVVTAYDPDAPTGSGWWHWVVFNLPAATDGLPQGAGSGSAAPPEGAVQSRTDFGPPGYGGACPPQGDAPHRYIFTVHALKVPSLPLDASAAPAMVGFYVHANSLASARLTVTYGR